MNANPVRARLSSAYLKDQFPFFGLMSEERRRLQHSWLAEMKDLNLEERWQLMHLLWNQPEREFHYVAIDWLNKWPVKWMDAGDGERLEYFIRTHSWWDSVDGISCTYLGKWEGQFPKEARRIFEQWRHADTFWLHRSCLIYQMKLNKRADIRYLESLIVQFLPNKEFFIQKAIGWSLRQLSKAHPEAVRRMLEEHPIKGLARREAEKYI